MANSIYLSVEIRNLKEKMVEVLNRNKLPFCVKQMVLKEVSDVVNEMAEREYASDIRAIEKEKEESKNKGTADSAVEGDQNDQRESVGDIEETGGND